MKTEVIMKRQLFNCEISQKSKSKFFSATDLVKAGNYWRSNQKLPLFEADTYYKSIEFKEFCKEIENKYGEARIIGRGRGIHTWIHPLIFIDMALKISPKLKIEVYEWLFDNLIQFRNDSGVSYKKMCGALYERYSSKSTFYKYIEQVAEKIKLACTVSDWNNASEAQLKKRDKIQDNITLLCNVLNNPNDAVRIAIEKIDF